ncbi:MAG: tetratricopeptide repeat protein [Defluviitaleaceae bacterium]|nr:tetratricopeptide repeat protein [Defluviitaleaceae bacterium]
MKCPNCKGTYDFGNKCPHCKADTVLYSRTVNVSNKLYNQGLDSVKALDLTHGIQSLTKSVAINKHNIDARNLLGLALFEVGHVGDAIKHWVISISIQPTDNLAETYLERVNKNTRGLEKLNDAVVMYNHALGHIKQKSDDLAIIQLKKSVENNPRFVDALNLLALCHMIQNDKERALSIVERVLVIDAQNPIALRYHAMLAPKGKTVKPITSTLKFANRERPPESHGPYKPIGISDKKSTNFHIAEIIAFVIGVVITGSIIYFLLFPALQSEHDRNIAQMEQTMTEAAETHQEEIANILAEKDALEVIIANREGAIQNFEAAAELQGRINAVYTAHMLHQENQLQEAIDILDNLNTAGMDSQTLNRIDAIREDAYPRLANIHFASGQQAFVANDYALALVELELAKRFMAEGITNQWRDLWFALGSIYYEDGRLEEALEMLTPLRENFPNTRPQATARMIGSIEARL